MLHDFPVFSNVDLELARSIKAAVSTYEPYSDFNFTSLFCWDTNDTTQASILNGNLVIKLPDYITGETVHSIIGTQKIDDSLDILLKTTSELKLVPEIVVKSLINPDNYIITEDPDNFDYIYDVKKIAELEGGLLKKKRNKVHKFNSELGARVSVQNTMTLGKELQGKILRLFDRWVEENNEPISSSASERKAITRLIKYSSKLNIVITELRLDDILIGFSANELLEHGYAICHFEKASLIHENIYTFLANQAAIELLKHNAKLVNWEQDLGIPGLRKSKASYQPIKLLKKFTLSRANS